MILRNGRALALEGAVRNAQAILVGWFLGTETGPALADILFGNVSPSGRLPVTFPLATGQQPCYYARERSGRPAGPGSTAPFTSHFLGIPDEPLYPFGHGLTYSTVEYGPTRCSAPTMTRDGELAISAQVTNRGARSVDEVVQLYIHDRVARVVQPVRRLVAFQKVVLARGASQTVAFRIRATDLGFLDRVSKRVIEPGDFDVWIAPSAGAGQSARFTLV